MNVKIIQILLTPNDYSWQGALLGLGDNGITYDYVGGKWVELILNPETNAWCR